MPAPRADDSFDVIIIGCGPTGALLAAHLGRLGVKHVILEREPDITTDPRGIALDEDGMRTLQGVGLYEALYTDIGKGMDVFQFIEGGKGLDVPPFLQFNYKTIEGGTGHVGFMAHKQPAMEKHLRAAIDPKYGELRGRATVTAISEADNGVVVEYVNSEGNSCLARAKFLVGADGKTGFVRKKYLEPKGIVMEKNPKFRYEAVWVALNWHLTPPTPQTHPDFPLWKLGYTPEEVYDLFFPKEFNFICDPERPAVCGRFGRYEDRLWRFEFVVKENEDGQKMATPEETRKIIYPYLTHPGKRYGLREEVVWPLDCVECIRSRPFSFSARSCNKWSLGRVILCGDAAHVFPPFGGQGITSGFRDALALAWRLKIGVQPDCNYFEPLLTGWYIERKQQLERSLGSTIENGNFVCEPSALKAFLRNWYLWAIQLVPAWKHDLQLGARREGMTRYNWTPGMPFLPQLDGGKSLPQVFTAPIDGPAPPIPSFTDDAIFAANKKGVFQLVVIVDSIKQLKDALGEVSGLNLSHSITGLDAAEATFVVHGQIPEVPNATSILGSEAALTEGRIIRVVGAEEYSAAGLTAAAVASGFPRPPPLYYNPDRIRKDLGYDKRYAIVRYDRFVFAACRNRVELEHAVRSIDDSLAQEVPIQIRSRL